MSPFLRAYFSRLSWTGEPDVSIDTLRELHLQHNSAIPLKTSTSCCRVKSTLTMGRWKRS